MNTPLHRTTGHTSAASTNPFARALAEARGGSATTDTNKNSFKPFPPVGGGFNSLDENAVDKWNDPDAQKKWQDQQKELQKKEMLRQKLFKEVNPVDKKEVFDARKLQVKREIEEIKNELKKLVVAVKDFEKDTQITLMTTVVDGGEEGAYYKSFFQKLRAFIIFLRQKISSAKTWATTMSSKNKKKKKNNAGIQFEGKGYKETKTVYDQMGQEVSGQQYQAG